MSDLKTAAAVLQELMVKLGETPHYECTAVTGMDHERMFEFRVAAHGAVGVAAARSKKEARQVAARAVLAELARLGQPVPPPYNSLPDEMLTASAAASSCAEAVSDAAQAALVTRNAVSMLKDLCVEYHLGDAEYELVGDAGPAHMRHFTIRVSLRGVSRVATATTKKVARQLAAHDLYTYYRDNLQRLTGGDYDEGEALVRAQARVMERYVDLRDHAGRPRVTLCLADYHLGLKNQLGPENCAAILERLKVRDPADDPVETLLALARELMPGVEVRNPPKGRHCIELFPTSPSLVFNGTSPAAAALHALRYLSLTLAM